MMLAGYRRRIMRLGGPIMGVGRCSCGRMFVGPFWRLRCSNCRESGR